MNCKGMRKIMAEFAAGELSEAVAKEAGEHVQVCKTCAEDLKRYAQALDALSEPRELLDLPDALSHLRIPEKQSRPVHRLRWAAVFFLAIGLVCTGIYLKPHRTSTTCAVQIPRKAPVSIKRPERIAKVEKVEPKGPIEQVTTSIKRRLNPNRRRKHRYFAWKPAYHHEERMASVKETKIDEPKPMPMVVIACVVEEPPSIEIESYNNETGVRTQYIATYGESGEQTGEIETKTQPKN